MKLTILSSSSAGNGYILSSGDEELLIEAGARNMLSHARNPVGCIVTHHHQDHAKYARQIARRIPLGSTPDVAGSIMSATSFKEGHTYGFSRFSVTPFHVPHYNNDETPCPAFGYVIRHPQMGVMLFATDTFSLPYRIPGVNHFFIEANYSDLLLNAQVEAGHTSVAQKKRIQLSHMSMHGCIETIRQCGTDKARTIILCHLSSRHANPSEFVHEIQGAFGIPTYAARKNMEITL